LQKCKNPEKKNPGTLNMKHEKKKREKQQIHTPGGRERERAMSSPKALLLCRACAPRADLSSSSSSPSSSSTSSRPSSTLTKSSGRRAALIFPTLSFLTTTAAPSSLAEEEGANSSNNNKNNNNNNSIVTSYAYFDIGTCESIVRAERALGGDAVCSKEDAEMLGRVKIGLFGDGSARDTVSMFKKLVESGAYDRTVFHDVRKGEFVAFGLNGSKRLGQVSIPDGTFAVGERNADFTKASAFSGKHLKPGVVSLALSYDGSRTASPFDGNVYTEVLITTGPAPVPSLDGKNIIFGQVDRESLDVIAKIANTPVFSPSSQVKAWNFIANRVGDERAAKSKLIWTKPTKAVAIFDSGILEV
jgi:peptidyl-prolyl cis-trans isomerase B (cyclophilin B)